MKIVNNRGEEIGSLDTAISPTRTVTVHRVRDVTTVVVRDRHKGAVTTETFYGDSPFGK